MKVNKNFTLDSHIVFLLSKEKNASKLIEDLLNEYYSEKTENLEKKIKELRAESAAIRKKMRIFKQKQAEKAKKEEHMLTIIKKYGSNNYRKVKWEDPEMQELADKLENAKVANR